jgi:hypothetical protein
VSFLLITLVRISSWAYYHLRGSCSDVAQRFVSTFNLLLLLKYRVFFLEHAGELHVISLIEENELHHDTMVFILEQELACHLDVSVRFFTPECIAIQL